MKISDLDYIFEYIGMSHDPRTHHLLPVNVSPFFVIWLIINWVLFTKSLGPAIMKNRQPYELRTPMFFYNCLMTWINIYSVYKVISLSNYFRVLFDVEYPDRNDMSEHSINLIHLGYLYWLTKLTDCFDTLFFVLRKKYDQITLLHVYHHTVVPLFGYLLLRINPLLPACFLFASKFFHNFNFIIVSLFLFIPPQKNSGQFYNSCYHVLILCISCIGTIGSKVFVVEKVHYNVTIVAICPLRNIWLHILFCTKELSHFLDVFRTDPTATILLVIL